MQVAKKDVVIDSGWDVLGFLPQAKALTGGHITFHTLPILGYGMQNGQSVNLIDTATVRAFVQNLFYPKPVAKSTAPASATPSPKPTKINFGLQANGKSVDGSKIPCVN